jgi:carbonic anhydrase
MRIRLFSVLLIAALCLGLIPTLHAEPPKPCPTDDAAQGATCDPHFTYTPGPHGPDHWGGECNTGERQAPIDIRHARKKSLAKIDFDYKPISLNILNDCNHYTVKIDTSAGASSITIDGQTYKLVQFHFHEPSEEAIRGQRAKMVIHLVHQNDTGKLAVVAVLVQVGAENETIAALWKNIPPAGEQRQPPGVEINTAGLLPPITERGYYTFDGSLTTPDCDQGVTWYVLKTPITLSEAQIAEYIGHYHETARPLQPRNGRRISETK